MKNALYSVGFEAKLYNNTSLQRHIYIAEEIKKYIFCLCDFYWYILIHSEIENIFFHSLFFVILLRKLKSFSCINSTWEHKTCVAAW